MSDIYQTCACGHVDHTSGNFGWCMDRGCPCIKFRPARAQVLADSDAAWHEWQLTDPPSTRGNGRYAAFIAGYLAAKDITA